MFKVLVSGFSGSYPVRFATVEVWDNNTFTDDTETFDTPGGWEETSVPGLYRATKKDFESFCEYLTKEMLPESKDWNADYIISASYAGSVYEDEDFDANAYQEFSPWKAFQRYTNSDTPANLYNYHMAELCERLYHILSQYTHETCGKYGDWVETLATDGTTGIWEELLNGEVKNVISEICTEDLEELANEENAKLNALMFD